MVGGSGGVSVEHAVSSAPRRRKGRTRLKTEDMGQLAESDWLRVGGVRFRRMRARSSFEIDSQNTKFHLLPPEVEMVFATSNQIHWLLAAPS